MHYNSNLSLSTEMECKGERAYCTWLYINVWNTQLDTKDWDANAGLSKARDRLEAVKDEFPEISYGDLYTLAGVVAIEKMGKKT